MDNAQPTKKEREAAAMLRALDARIEDPDSWEANAQYMLERCPYTVWQRPGGHLDLKATLVATFMGMQMRLEGHRHMEELQAAKDAIARPWQPMKTAPKDGTAVLVLLEGSDVPKAVKWCKADHFLATDGAGWYMPWDGTKIKPHEGPRYWMHCPDDPDALQGEARPPSVASGSCGRT